VTHPNRTPPTSQWKPRTRRGRLRSRRRAAVLWWYEVRKEFPDYGPFRLVRLIPKRKPKTPREVFVTMSADGVPRDAWLLQWDAEHEVAAHRSGTRYDRVVRYVLAEGE
jgi:hypothetical protein